MVDSTSYKVIEKGESYQDNGEGPQYAVAIGEKTVLLDIPISVLDKNRTQLLIYEE